MKYYNNVTVRHMKYYNNVTVRHMKYYINVTVRHLKYYIKNIKPNTSLVQIGMVNNFKFQTLFSFRPQMLVIKAGIHKMFIRVANREDSDLIASSEAV